MPIATDAESRLAARERTIARLQTMARAASWTLDPWTGEAEWSQDMFTLFGFDRSAAPSFNKLVAMLDPAHRDRWHKAFAEACRMRPVSGVACNVHLASGERRRIRLHIDPELDANGRVMHLSGICQDVTDAALGDTDLARGMAGQMASLLMVVIDNVAYAEGLAGADGCVARALKTASEAAKLVLDLTSQQDAATDRPLSEAEMDPDPAQRSAVLVVGDDAPIRKLVTAMVDSLDYPVVEAAGAEDALAAVTHGSDIALLVADVAMSGMDGAELAGRALAIRPDLKVLLASGFDGPDPASLAGLGRPVDVIAKPFTRAALADKLRRALAPARAA